MKDYDAIARELNLRMPCEVKGHENDCPHPHVLCSECCERRKIARDAAILRKHDEAEASGELPMALSRTLANGVTKFISIKRDSEGDACGWNFETEKAAQWIAAQLAHVRKIEARGGSCDGLMCVHCPIDCSIVESDAIMLHKAREWLKANAS